MNPRMLITFTIANVFGRQIAYKSWLQFLFGSPHSKQDSTECLQFLWKSLLVMSINMMRDKQILKLRNLPQKSYYFFISPFFIQNREFEQYAYDFKVMILFNMKVTLQFQVFTTSFFRIIGACQTNFLQYVLIQSVP